MDDSPSSGYPSIKFAITATVVLLHMGGEGQYEGKVSCNGQALNPVSLTKGLAEHSNH